jgi:ribonuclease D
VDVKPIELEAEVRELARTLASAPRIAVDLEYNGMHAYRARVCTAQLASGGVVAVVDAIAAGIAPLAPVLGDERTVKVVHDVGFDARMLAEVGIDLAGVHDTAIASRMLGHTATGLAAVLLRELGIVVNKEMQSYDWGKRPLDPRAVEYAAKDVLHLEALDDALWAQVRARDIEAEVLEETRHRVATARDAALADAERPAWTKLKGLERIGGVELGIIRALSMAREHEAERRDVPVHYVLSADALFAIAHARPGSIEQLRRMRGAPRDDRFGQALVTSVANGLSAGPPPEDEARWIERPRVGGSDARARRGRETKLLAWRREEAQRRGVDEQVVLPGHCVKDIAGKNVASVDDLVEIAGLGAFRVARDGAAIVHATTSDLPTEEGAT